MGLVRLLFFGSCLQPLFFRRADRLADRETRDLLHRVKVMQNRADTFTVRIVRGSVELEGEQAFLDRALDFGELVERFSSQVADINITFTRHDQPACQLDWFQKERMLHLASMGDCEFWGPESHFHS